MDVDLAKMNADKPEEDEELRKKLWLEIGRISSARKQHIVLLAYFYSDESVMVTRWWKFVIVTQ